jgi:hypothetical protein
MAENKLYHVLLAIFASKSNIHYSIWCKSSNKFNQIYFVLFYYLKIMSHPINLFVSQKIKTLKLFNWNLYLVCFFLYPEYFICFI